MKEDYVWKTTVTDLMNAFREGLVVLVPVADSVRIQWREPYSYDDWDEIAQCLFQQIVVRSLGFSRECPGDLRIPQYDLLLASYTGSDLIRVTDKRGDRDGDPIFLGFRTAESPFDRVECLSFCADGVVNTEDPILLPADQATYCLSPRAEHGMRSRIEVLHIEL